MSHQTARALVRAATAALLLAGTTGALAVTAAPAAAQPPEGGRGGGRGQAMMQNMLFEGITLTDAQKAKVDSIRAASREKMMAERGNAGGPPDSATMAARRERMQAERTALRAVLTADQQATFDKNVLAMEERMRTMRRGAGAPPR